MKPTGSVLFTKSSDSLRHYMYWGWLIRIHCKEKTNNMWRFFGHINLDHFEIKKVANVKTVPNNVLKNCPTRGGTFYLCSWNRNRFAQCKNYFSNGSQTTVASYRSAHVQVQVHTTHCYCLTLRLREEERGTASLFGFYCQLHPYVT